MSDLLNGDGTADIKIVMNGTDGKYEIDTNEDGHVVFLKSNYGYDGIFDPFSSHD